MRQQTPAFFKLLTLISLLGCMQTANAHGDEDHSHPSSASASASASASVAISPNAVNSAQRLTDGSLFIPKLVQRQWGVRTVMTEIQDRALSVELNGKVVNDPNAGGRVQAGQPGRIEAGPKGLPVLGQRVTKGQILAYLRPLPASLERGTQQALLVDLDAQLSLAESNLKRVEKLADALPRIRIEEARVEVDGLKKRRAAVANSLASTEALVAPVSGVIGSSAVLAGQVVDTKEILFELQDPERLAVEALAYDPVQAAGLIQGSRASAALGNQELALEFLGAGSQLREQALPLLFRVLPSPQRAGKPTLALGQPLKIIAKTNATSKGASLPQAALVRNTNGDVVVWVHTEAERFVTRQVRYQALDAQNVLITSGLNKGERVVSMGASLLAQVR